MTKLMQHENSTVSINLPHSSTIGASWSPSEKERKTCFVRSVVKMDFNQLVSDQVQLLEDSNILGGNKGTVHERLFHAAKDAIKDEAEEILHMTTAGVANMEEVFNHVKTVPGNLKKDMEVAPSKLHELQDIASGVQMLLTSLQTAVQRPSTVFPRFVCGEIPVDPARLANLQKRHSKVQRLNDEDPELQATDRSLPNPPKSGLDVITNVTSSFETFADNVLVTAESIKKLFGDFEALQTAAGELEHVHQPILGLIQEQSFLNTNMSCVTNAFQNMTNNNNPQASRALPQQQLTNNFFEEMSFVARTLDMMKDSVDSISTNVDKVEEAAGKLSSMAENVQKTFDKAMKCLSRFVDSVKRLHSNLPRISRELEGFFMPKGLKALVLRPSDALLSILQSIEDIKKCLSETQNVACFAMESLSNNESSVQMESVRDKLRETMEIPLKLYELLVNLDLKKSMKEGVELEISKMVEEIASEAVGETVTEVLGAVGVGGLASNVMVRFGIREAIDKRKE